MSDPKRNNSSDEEVLNSISISKIILPVVLGLAVVLYLLWRSFDQEEFAKISWDGHMLFWICMAIFCYVLRHLFYAYRLRVLADKDFSWTKSIELIFIWEFASAVSPTSIGGSAVALFLLAQEKISTARTVAIVLYSVIIDTLFFVISMVLLYFIIGPMIIRPGMTSMNMIDGFGLVFLLVVLAMLAYSFIFFYGLFINPTQIKRLLLWVSKWKILGKFRNSIRETAMDVVMSAKEMKSKSWTFHLKSNLATAGAWTFRFLAINCIIICLVKATPLDFWTQLLMFARGEVMYAVTAFSPTPGGAGIAEIVFGGYYSDFISKSLSFLAALLWRLITYYPYLIAGAIIIPNWIRKIANRRKNQKKDLQTQ